ncbi:VOC family protein [Dendrosporobacter sp. 1207_IL3150]|uniref:VOC family protein n=1 Tax=Dendrosporobacter sp. 1207_IL3150 TaxID=3084054 RepID=UPI002FDB933D
MAVEAYISFNGNCREAVEFYTQVFNAEKPQIMTYGQMPPDPNFTVPEDAKNLIVHTRLTISGSNVMFSDVPPGMGQEHVRGNNISLTIVTTNIDEIKTYYEKLKQGGTILMELQETFWSKCYGYVIDKFGIHWQLSHDGGQRA